MFNFTKKEYGTGESVWWNKVLLGNIELIVRENPDIDWQALRQDKALRLTTGDRWNVTFAAMSSIGKHSVGIFESRTTAAEAILNHHNEYFLKLQCKN